MNFGECFFRNCPKSPDSPKTKAVETYETGKKSSACCGMPAISAHETLLSDFLDSFSETSRSLNEHIAEHLTTGRQAED
jgi:hypothetical protein